jgi:hypothetical protein
MTNNLLLSEYRLLTKLFGLSLPRENVMLSKIVILKAGGGGDKKCEIFTCHRFIQQNALPSQTRNANSTGIWNRKSQLE